MTRSIFYREKILSHVLGDALSSSRSCPSKRLTFHERKSKLNDGTVEGFPSSCDFEEKKAISVTWPIKVNEACVSSCRFYEETSGMG